MKIPKRAKKCMVCERLLREHNKSGLCSYHRMVRDKNENQRSTK